MYLESVADFRVLFDVSRSVVLFASGYMRNDNDQKIWNLSIWIREIAHDYMHPIYTS